ncbi:Hypothetical predicted protein, partial [Marmota monax]
IRIRKYLMMFHSAPRRGQHLKPEFPAPLLPASLKPPGPPGKSMLHWGHAASFTTKDTVGSNWIQRRDPSCQAFPTDARPPP